MDIRQHIRNIPDFPSKGILFKDITTLLQNGEVFHNAMSSLVNRYKDQDFDVIAGIESRGFILGSVLSYALKKGFVPIRKKGKLPGDILSKNYALEYGTDTLEIHKDGIQKGQKVLLIDDLLATGGTVLTSASLVEELGGIVFEIAFLINLKAVGGSKKLDEKGHKHFSLIEYDD